MFATTSDRFGAMELTPRHDEPLLVPGSAPLEAMATPCVVSVRVVAAEELRPMQKGIISNAMVEVSLVHDAESSRVQRSKDSNLKMPLGRQTSRAHVNSRSCFSIGNQSQAQMLKPFQSKVVKSSLNPIWNFDVDFGDIDTDSVRGVLFIVRHVERFGFVKKDIGQIMLSLREILELKLQPPHEQTFHLQSTEKMLQRDAMEGPSNRKSGKLTIRFNGYGVPSRYNVTTNGRVSNMVNTVVTHEDDFESCSKSLVVHDIRDEVRKMQSFHETKPKPGEIWFAVNADWVHAWLLFVSKHKGKEAHNPGIVDNMPLISDDLTNGTFQLKTGLVIKKDFRMINEQSWNYYQHIYGGGPAIEVQIPRDCTKPAQWLENFQLEKVARVNSNYVDMH